MTKPSPGAVPPPNDRSKRAGRRGEIRGVSPAGHVRVAVQNCDSGAVIVRLAAQICRVYKLAGGVEFGDEDVGHGVSRCAAAVELVVVDTGRDREIVRTGLAGNVGISGLIDRDGRRLVAQAAAQIGRVGEGGVDHEWQRRVVGADLEADLITGGEHESAGHVVLGAVDRLIQGGGVLQKRVAWQAEDEVSLASSVTDWAPWTANLITPGETPGETVKSYSSIPWLP